MDSTNNNLNLHIFPITVYKTTLPNAEALNTALIQLIDNLQHTDPGITRSNAGGWHSDSDLHLKFPEVISPLTASIIELAAQATSSTFEKTVGNQWEMMLWANVNHRDSYNKWHDHIRSDRPQNNIWSGVYYVSANNNQGNIIFRDDFQGPDKYKYNLEPPLRTHSVTPSSGTLLIFPSWLRHSVEANNTSTPRISIAFNLFHPEMNYEVKPSYRRFTRAWKKYPVLMKKLDKISPIGL